MPSIYSFTNPDGKPEKLELRGSEDFSTAFKAKYPDHPVPKPGEYETDVRRLTVEEEEARDKSKDGAPFDYPD